MHERRTVRSFIQHSFNLFIYLFSLSVYLLKYVFIAMNLAVGIVMISQLAVVLMMAWLDLHFSFSLSVNYTDTRVPFCCASSRERARVSGPHLCISRAYGGLR